MVEKNASIGRRGSVAVIIDSGRLLVIRRAQTVEAPGTYCFPGGGIEQGETEKQALIRELHEELGVQVHPIRRVWQCVTSWQVQLYWWLAHLEEHDEPKPNPLEVESFCWVTPIEMARLPNLLESNQQFLEALAENKIDLSPEIRHSS